MQIGFASISVQIKFYHSPKMLMIGIKLLTCDQKLGSVRVNIWTQVAFTNCNLFMMILTIWRQSFALYGEGLMLYLTNLGYFKNSFMTKRYEGYSGTGMDIHASIPSFTFCRELSSSLWTWVQFLFLKCRQKAFCISNFLRCPKLIDGVQRLLLQWSCLMWI